MHIQARGQRGKAVIWREKMSKKQGILITLISLASLCLSAASLSITLRPPVKEERDIQYVMYLGTNDKDRILF